MLGPILFILNLADLPALIEGRDLLPHQDTDDNQTYGACLPSEVHMPSSEASECIDDTSQLLDAV
jgi:hypothetical protein